MIGRDWRVFGDWLSRRRRAPRRPVEVAIRSATEADLPRVVELIHLGAITVSNEEPGPPLPEGYYRAFAAIQADPDGDLFVAEAGGEVVGTFQFTVLPNISNQGRPVAQVESVHVAEAFRGRGVGELMMQWAIDEARRRGCVRLQLTSNKARHRAHRFYRRLGFHQSHEGMKFYL